MWDRAFTPPILMTEVELRKERLEYEEFKKTTDESL